jgi:hypothetical protein
VSTAVLSRPAERRAYEPRGAARSAWRSAGREILLSGPADTGKSRGVLEKLHYCANKYTKMRACIVRKTRNSLNQSAIVTYEQKVLTEGWLAQSMIEARKPVRTMNGNWTRRIYFSTSEQEYVYPNGSIIAIAGLDNPEKLKSTEWDLLYFMEATEGTEHDWEMMTRGLRNGVMPYQQLLADCNPSYPHHWLKKRCERGATRMLYSRHADNPSITSERIALLQALTGVRRKRLYEGIWAAAEGLVYEEWNPAVHIVTKKQLQDWGVFYTDGTLNRQIIRQVVGGADWGWSNPGVLQAVGIDHDGRCYLLAEIYRTQRNISWWIEQGRMLDREFHIQQWVGDPSQPSYIEEFNKAGLSMHRADNAILPGINALQTRLKPAGDGRPRFYVYEYSLRDRDESRDAAKQPVCFENEVNEYVWLQPKEGQAFKEMPAKNNDHSLDTSRYICRFVDNGATIGESEYDTADAIRNYRGYSS